MFILPTRLLRSYYVLLVSVSLLITGVVTASAPAALAAEDDVAKKLIGKWEGNVAIKNGFRTLVIERVKREGDQWTAIGRYGVTGNNLGKMTYKITVSGNDAEIEFTTGADYPAKLKLVGDSELKGTLRVPGHMKNTTANADMTLKKVE